MISKAFFSKPCRIFLRLSLILILCGLLFFIIFRSLQGPIHLWDEALYANNALDMVENRQYLVYTVADTIDHHNTKPPLVLWMQAAAGACLGFSEASVRLPTYLALVGLLVLLCVYLHRFTSSILPGLLASLFCLTTIGLIRHHVFLTGDLDGVLVFWTTWISLHWIDCLMRAAIKSTDYVILTLLFCAGYLTKSTAVLLIIPSLFVIGCFYGRRFLALLASPRTVYGIIASFTLCVTYYLLREHYDPGYWFIVRWSEFTRLRDDLQPWLHYKWSFYFERFYDPLFQEYILLLAELIMPFLIIPGCANKRLVLALLSGAAVFLAFITVPPVKLEYYDAPIYPLICSAMALIIREIIKAGLITGTALRLTAVSVLIIVVAIVVKNSFIRVEGELSKEPHSDDVYQTVPDALKIIHERHPHILSFKILLKPIPKRYAHHRDELTFYKTIYQHYEGRTVIVSERAASFSAGDTLICNREILDQLEKDNTVIRLDSTAGGGMWIVLGAHNSTPIHSDIYE